MKKDHLGLISAVAPIVILLIAILVLGYVRFDSNLKKYASKDTCETDISSLLETIETIDSSTTTYLASNIQ